VVEELKRCNTCGESKALTNFGRHSVTKDGRRNACKPCDSARVKARYRDTRAERLEYQKQYKVRNPERYRALQQAWVDRNRDKVHAIQSRRRAAKRGATHAPYSRAAIFAEYGGTCAYCDAPAEHLDHVVALSRGGADAPHNLLPACAPCNLSKGAKSLAEWVLSWGAATR